MTERFDVVVVGAGPAGATAARVAAEGGARVLLLDAARFPRYKTCGGGLIGTSLAELPPAALAVVERRVRTVSIARAGGRARRIRTAAPFLAMVSRTALDAALVDAAVAAGVEFRDHVRVREPREEPDGAVLRLGDGEVHGSIVIGADGSAGVTGRFVGVRIARADLGLELEIASDDPTWDSRVHLDWGRTPGSYGWVFPKDGRLSVGVVQRKGDGPATRAYLDAFVAAMGTTGPVERSSGHLIQWRAPGSPLRRGRVLVAGDAAGLVEPWTREGISFALRSGRLAGQAAAEALRSPATERDAALAAYERAVVGTLEPEQRAGAALLRLFERWPVAVHLAVTRTGIGATAFVRFCRGSLSLARVARHRVAGPVLRILAR
jgi:geranylgeranyl reductase family protein